MNTENGNGLSPVALHREATCLTEDIARSLSRPERVGHRGSDAPDGRAGRILNAGTKRTTRAAAGAHTWGTMLNLLVTDTGGPTLAFRLPTDSAEPPSPTPPSDVRRPTTPNSTPREAALLDWPATSRTTGAGDPAPDGCGRTEVTA